MSKLILVTNDDGIHAKGIQTLTRLMAPLGEVYVVAPDSARSGAGCSITPTRAVEIRHLQDLEEPHNRTTAQPHNPIHLWSCSGTPVDCVKLACEQVVPRQPDLIVSGINHGDNASISLHYSGTMGAVFEGCMKDIPSIGYSLRTGNPDADFTPYGNSIVKIASHILSTGLPHHTCLNVNYPEVPVLQGTRVCRLADGSWSAEWLSAHHPYGKKMFWLTGHFTNLEPLAEDTDYWALDHGYGAVTPIKMDMTDYDCLENLKDLMGS